MKSSNTCLVTCSSRSHAPPTYHPHSPTQPNVYPYMYISLSRSNWRITSIFVVKTKRRFTFLELWLSEIIITSGDMAGLVDKAKEFVTDKVANMKKPEANVTDVDLKGVACDCITYNAKVNVSNPYSTSIPICEISYTFKSAGRVIAEGTIPDPGSLKGNDDTMLDVGVKVPHNVLVSLVKDIGADWDIDYELAIALIVDLPVIGNFSIPVSSKGEIKLPTFSSLFG